MDRREFLCAAAGAALPIRASPASEESFEEMLRREVPRLQARYNVPGVAIGMIGAESSPRFLGFGVRHAARNALVDQDTIFQVGSISKFATAVCTMRLVERGVLALDAPINRYLKRWRLSSDRFDVDRVTPRLLLSHSAGLSVHGYFPGYGFPGSIPNLLDSVRGKTAAEEAVRVLSPPGERYEYSGGGYSVLQIALEDVTGVPFTDLAARLLLKPAGMHRSSFAFAQILDRNAAGPHDLGGGPMPVRVLPQLAAAGLSTTARDLAMLLEAALGPASGRRGLLSPPAAALLATPIAPTGAPPARLGSNQAMLAPETFPTPSAFRYGPGGAIATRADGRRIIGHGGSNAGWKASVQYSLETGDGIVVLTNAEPGNGIVFRVISLWRERLDALAGRSPGHAALEQASPFIAAAFGRTNASTAAAGALRHVVAEGPGHWLFSDHTGDEAASIIREFAPVTGYSQSQIDTSVLALAVASADLFPGSGFAQAAAAVEFALNGRRSDAEAAMARAERTGPDQESRRLMDAAGKLLGDAKSN